MRPTESKLWCQVRLGDERSAPVIALLESTSALPCPCKRGLTCPLAPVAPAAAAV